jgi:hypothetical protein
MIWCPYTDREVAETEVNREHILPLALGGSDQFVIPVDKSVNSTVGSQIDGAIEKEFVVKFARREFDAQGQSGKKPEVVFKYASLEGRPVQVQFLGGNNVPRVWDAKARRYLDPEEVVGKSIGINWSINQIVRFRFAAKGALSAGYFAYGDWWRHHVDHAEARSVMNIRTPAEWRSVKPKVLVHDLYSEIPQEQKVLGSVLMLCTSFKGSSVFMLPDSESILVVVGILGGFLSSIRIPADTSHFPGGLNDLGDSFLVAEGKLVRIPWRELLRQLYNQGSAQCGSELEGLPESI